MAECIDAAIGTVFGSAWRYYYALLTSQREGKAALRKLSTTLSRVSKYPTAYSMVIAIITVVLVFSTWNRSSLPLPSILPPPGITVKWKFDTDDWMPVSPFTNGLIVFGNRDAS